MIRVIQAGIKPHALPPRCGFGTSTEREHHKILNVSQLRLKTRSNSEIEDDRSGAPGKPR